MKASKYELRNLHLWSLYIDGARDLLLRLRDDGVELFNDPAVKKPERAVYSRAIYEYLLAEKSNLDHFLLQDGEGRFYDHERDMHGRLVGCKFAIFKPQTIYKKL